MNLATQLRQMGQARQYRRIPILEEDPMQHGAGHPWLLPGTVVTSSTSGGHYEHQIVEQQANNRDGIYKDVFGTMTRFIALLDSGDINCGGFGPPPEATGWTWWPQFRFPIDCPPGSVISNARLRLVNAFHGYDPASWDLWHGKVTVFNQDSTPPFLTNADCYLRTNGVFPAEDLLPTDDVFGLEVGWTPEIDFPALDDPMVTPDISELIQHFVSRPGYIPYSPQTPDDGWIGLAVRWTWASGGLSNLDHRNFHRYWPSAGPRPEKDPILEFDHTSSAGPTGLALRVAVDDRVRQLFLERQGG